MSGQTGLTCWRAVTAESPYVRSGRPHLLEGGDGGAPAGEAVHAPGRPQVPQLQTALLAGHQHLVQVGAGVQQTRHPERGVAEGQLGVQLCGDRRGQSAVVCTWHVRPGSRLQRAPTMPTDATKLDATYAFALVLETLPELFSTKTLFEMPISPVLLVQFVFVFWLFSYCSHITALVPSNFFAMSF